jgi:hypothetical protein
MNSNQSSHKSSGSVNDRNAPIEAGRDALRLLWSCGRLPLIDGCASLERLSSV